MWRIVLFDGECNFCDASVQFILKQDAKARFHFAALQSEIGQELLTALAVPKDLTSLVLLEGERAYTKSTAALKIAKQLDGFWKAFYVALLIPKPLRDWGYNYIAKNRYKWFGRKQSCLLPTAQQRGRFL